MHLTDYFPLSTYYTRNSGKQRRAISGPRLCPTDLLRVIGNRLYRPQE